MHFAEDLEGEALRDLMPPQKQGVRCEAAYLDTGRVKPLDCPLGPTEPDGHHAGRKKGVSVWRNCHKKLQTHTHQVQSRTKMRQELKMIMSRGITMTFQDCPDKKMIVKVCRCGAGREKKITCPHIQRNTIAIRHYQKF